MGTVTGAAITIGAAATTGIVTITSGASGTFNSIEIGANAGSFGILCISDQGTGEVNNNVTAGDAGGGELLVDTGGSLTVAGDVVLGNQSGSSGSFALIFGSGSTLTVDGDVTDGNAGSGNLEVMSGATATVDGSLLFAQKMGGSGSATVSGQGSTLTIDGDLTGEGTADVNKGAKLEIDGSVSADSTITFSGDATPSQTTTTLVLDDPAKVLGDIILFPQGDIINLPNASPPKGLNFVTYDADGLTGDLFLNGIGTIDVTVASNEVVPTFEINKDSKNGGIDVETTQLTTLMDMALATYNYGTTANPNPPMVGAAGPDGYKIIADVFDPRGFEAIAYELQQPGGTPNIIIAFRGTQVGAGVPAAIKNILADTAFLTGLGNPILDEYVSEAATFVQAVVSANAGAVITLTGHSLGGALAQLVGEASDFAVAAFNAPGGQALYGQLSSELAPADGLGYGGTDINYIVDGDQVSFAGVPIGQQFTINGPYGINASSSPGDIAANMLNNHTPAVTASTLLQPASAYAQGQTGPDIVPLMVATGALGSIVAGAPLVLPVTFFVAPGAAYVLDPASGTDFVFAANAGSPNFASIELPFDPGVVSAYNVRYEIGTTWSAFQQIQPGVQFVLPTGVNGIKFDPVNSSGQPVAISDGFALTATFTVGGQFSGTLTVNGVQPLAEPVIAPANLTVADDSGVTAIGIAAPTDAAFPSATDLAVLVMGLPTNGTVFLSDGSTAVYVGETLTVAQLTTLTFKGQSDGTSSFFYSVADPTFAQTFGQVDIQVGNGTQPIQVATIQNDYLGITRNSLDLADATTEANAINTGADTEAKYVNGLLSQVADTAIPVVAVEASMYGAVGSSAEITKLVTQFLPGQLAYAQQIGLDPQVFACLEVGLAFAFGNENGSTAFANNFGPSNAAMPGTPAGDAAFAAAAANAIFGSAQTANTAPAILGYVNFLEGFFAANGIVGVQNPTTAQIDLAARAAAWGDGVAIALANNLGPLVGPTTNFLEDAAQGTAIYSASLAGQPASLPFQGTATGLVATAASSVQVTGLAANADHIVT